jgi:hypothetical protein
MPAQPSPKRVKTYAELVAIPTVLPVKYHRETWHCLRHGEFRSRLVQPSCPECVSQEAAK